MSKIRRPDWDEYYMGIAIAVRRRANCLGNRVGAIIVIENHVVATGYNGTPSGLPNCDAGGCSRCAQRERFKPGAGYDLCICVHAEQNALLMAARFGIKVQGAICYTTMRPCFGCTKELLQAKVTGVRYLHDWQHPDPTVAKAYVKLQRHFPGGCRQLDVPDPEADWAVSRRRQASDIGHYLPVPRRAPARRARSGRRAP